MHTGSFHYVCLNLKMVLTTIKPFEYKRNLSWTVHIFLSVLYDKSSFKAQGIKINVQSL